MALAVASTSTVTTNNAGSLTLPAASGIATGDLLVIIASKYQTGAASCTGFTESFAVSNVVGGDTAERQCSITVLYKIAVLADESETNYSVNVGGGDGGGSATMLRITGWTSGDPVYENESTTGTFPGVGAPSTLGQSGLTTSRPGSGIALMGFVLNNSDGGTGIFSFSGYTITSSDTNPTWTEVIDAGATVNQGTDSATNHLAVAYANFSDTSTITAYEASLTESTSDGTGYAAFLAMLIEPTDAAGTTALLETTTTTFSEAAVSVGTTATHTLLEPTTTLNTPTSRGTSPTVWTNETDVDTTWTNENKL